MAITGFLLVFKVYVFWIFVDVDLYSCECLDEKSIWVFGRIKKPIPRCPVFPSESMDNMHIRQLKAFYIRRNIILTLSFRNIL